MPIVLNMAGLLGLKVYKVAYYRGNYYCSIKEQTLYNFAYD